MQPFSEYELLTQRLVAALARHFGASTIRCDQNVVVQGRATRNQIDVLWEGTIDGEHRRMVFECKHHKRRVEQGRLFSFRSVLADIEDGVQTDGIFVTTTGYQSGALAVADTYGILVLELREPRVGDLAGRVSQIQITATVRTVDVQHVQVAVGAAIQPPVERLVVNPVEALLLFPDGSERSLYEHLVVGETSPLGATPRELHHVQRRMPQGTRLKTPEHEVVVHAIEAQVGDLDTTVSTKLGPGLNGVAHVLHDALTGAAVWFASDGTIYTPSLPDEWLK